MKTMIDRVRIAGTSEERALKDKGRRMISFPENLPRWQERRMIANENGKGNDGSYP